MTKRLSIIIVNFKNPPLLRLCLASLIKTLEPTFEKEIIVVDVSSSIETRNVISEFPEVGAIHFKNNIGYTRGVNEGIKASRGEIVLIINPDIIPLKGSIEGMTDYIHKNNKIGLLGPQLLNFDGSVQNSSFAFYSPLTILYRRTFLNLLPWANKELNRFLGTNKDKTKTSEVDWIMGSALMTTKKAIDDIGPMDENLFLYMSEVDWAHRFWENDYKVVYFPGARMYHYHRRGSKGRLDAFDIIKKETRWHIIDAIKYFRKHGISAKSFSQ
ncbi:MAG: glycosyltransferase family 2 protein [bacterium]|nr:glycosyltransferase family 2 protein [bacterium]